MRFRALVVLVVLSVVMGASLANADSECVKGYHEVTPDELATMTRVLETARAAVPAPPEGWVNTLNDDSVKPPSGVCLDFSPWVYSYGRNYTRVEGHEEREGVIADAGADFKAAMAEKQPRLDALMAQMNETSAAYATAVTEGDSTKMQELQHEMERLSEEQQRIFNEGDPMAAYEAATASQYLDLEMNVSVSINPFRDSPPEGARTFQANGATSAWEWTEDEREMGGALVLFGTWQDSPSGYGLDSVPVAGAPPYQAQAISVRIQAHRDRLHSMIDATDFAALAKLLAK